MYRRCWGLAINAAIMVGWIIYSVEGGGGHQHERDGGGGEHRYATGGGGGGCDQPDRGSTWDSIQIFNKISNKDESKSCNTWKTSLPKVVFVLGGPGVGKGTQCKKIVSQFGFVHLSAGELLRTERNTPGSEYGELIDHHITNGTIVPTFITINLLDRAMNQSGNKLFLIDGFPRNQENLAGWNTSMEDKVSLISVLFFNATREVCMERCLSRWQGRDDDSLETLKKRFVTYEVESLPIVEHFEGNNLLRKIDATGSVDEIYAKVEEIIESIIRD